MFKMVKKMQNSGFEIVAGLTRPLRGIKSKNACEVCKNLLFFFFFAFFMLKLSNLALIHL